MIGSKADVEHIKTLYKGGMSKQDISNELNLHIDTVRKHIGTNRHPQFKETLPPPAVAFPLKVGDIISAYETEVCGHRRDYRVISIGKHIYTAERVNGYPWKASFEIKTFGLKSDAARVRLVKKH